MLSVYGCCRHEYRPAGDQCQPECFYLVNSIWRRIHVLGGKQKLNSRVCWFLSLSVSSFLFYFFSSFPDGETILVERSQQCYFTAWVFHIKFFAELFISVTYFKGSFLPMQTWPWISLKCNRSQNRGSVPVLRKHHHPEFFTSSFCEFKHHP